MANIENKTSKLEDKAIITRKCKLLLKLLGMDDKYRKPNIQIPGLTERKNRSNDQIRKLL